jgi:hypothetical protein
VSTNGICFSEKNQQHDESKTETKHTVQDTNWCMVSKIIGADEEENARALALGHFLQTKHTVQDTYWCMVSKIVGAVEEENAFLRGGALLLLQRQRSQKVPAPSEGVAKVSR